MKALGSGERREMNEWNVSTMMMILMESSGRKAGANGPIWVTEVSTLDTAMGVDNRATIFQLLKLLHIRLLRSFYAFQLREH